MHRDIAHHLVFLALTYLLVSAAGSALLPADTRHAQPPPVPCHHDDRPTYCRACNRSPYRPAPAPRCQPQPCRGGSDLERPPGGGVTRRGRRGASARRRGSRGGQVWRRSGLGGRQRNLLLGLINIQSLLPKIAALQHDHLNRLQYDVCIITETWLRPATASRLVTFPGYALHRADRPGTRATAAWPCWSVTATRRLSSHSRPQTVWTADWSRCGCESSQTPARTSPSPPSTVPRGVQCRPSTRISPS